MRRSKIILFIFLISLFMPISIDALENNIYVKDIGTLPGNLKSDYYWNDSGEQLLTAKECDSKPNSIRKYSSSINEWTSYKLTCSAKIEENENTVCDSIEINSKNETCDDVIKVVKCIKSGAVYYDKSPAWCEKNGGVTSGSDNRTCTISESKTTNRVANVTTNSKKITVLAKDNPNKDIYKFTNTFYYCSWDSDVVSTKVLYQDRYATSTGQDLFCLQPGKPFSEQNYQLVSDWKYNVNDCNNYINKSGEQKFYCGLISTLSEVKQKYGNDYETAVIALRLWASYASEDTNNGWWDSQSGYILGTANIYENTLKYILSNGYEGLSASPKTGVIYGTGTGLSHLQNAINVFNNVKNGNVTIWSPKITIDKSYYTVDKNNQINFIISTNFDENTKNIVLTANNGVNVSINSIGKCENDNSKYCINATATMPKPLLITSFTLNISYTHPSDVISGVGLYSSSVNPNYYQHMLEFDETTGSETDIEIRISDGVCNPDDPDSPDFNENWEEEGWEDGCTPNQNNPDCCELDEMDIDDELNCEDETSVTTEDPTMCEILNSCDLNEKKKYKDNTLSNNYCDVYCREVYKFNFMSKEQVIAGRQFVYSVDRVVETEKHLSIAIYAIKECTSVINNNSWQTAYNNVNSEVISTWNEYKKWEVLYGNNGTPDASYVCNGDSGTECNGGCTTKNVTCASTMGYRWNYDFYNITNSNGYNSKKCDGAVIGGKCTGTYNSSCSSCSCSEANTKCNDCSSCAEGSSSSECCKDTCSGGGCTTGTNGNLDEIKVKYSQALTNYLNALGRREELVAKIQNCNFIDSNTYKNDYITGYKSGYSVHEVDNDSQAGNNTVPVSTSLSTYKLINSYDFTNGSDSINLSYESNYNDEIKITEESKIDKDSINISYCNNCTYNNYCDSKCGEMGSLSNFNYVNNTYWYCTGSGTSAKCEKRGITLPSNSMASISFGKESQYFQSTKFYTQIFTGDVSSKTNDVGVWIPLDDYIYPIEIDRENGTYDVNVKLKDIGNLKDFDYNCAYQVINESINYVCGGINCCKIENGIYYGYDGTEVTREKYIEECTQSDNDGSLGFVFRSVDLKDLFPTDRKIGSNWSSKPNLIKAIEDLGEYIWVDSEPQYTIVLTPTNIKNIKDYNKSTNYNDYTLKCDENYNCVSMFLSNMVADNLATKVDYNSGRGSTMDFTKENCYNMSNETNKWYCDSLGGGN